MGINGDKENKVKFLRKKKQKKCSKYTKFLTSLTAGRYLGKG